MGLARSHASVESHGGSVEPTRAHPYRRGPAYRATSPIGRCDRPIYVWTLWAISRESDQSAKDVERRIDIPRRTDTPQSGLSLPA